MSDIKQAIQELRSLIDNEPVEIALIHSALDRLESSVEGGTVEVDKQLQAACNEMMFNGSVIGRPHEERIRFDLTLMVETIKKHLTVSPTPDLTSRIEAIEAAAEEIATKADEGWPALRCDKCGSLELIRNVPEDGYDCRGCSNFTRTPDEVIGITKNDLEKLSTAIITRYIEGGK